MGCFNRALSLARTGEELRSSSVASNARINVSVDHAELRGVLAARESDRQGSGARRSRLRGLAARSVRCPSEVRRACSTAVYDEFQA